MPFDVPLGDIAPAMGTGVVNILNAAQDRHNQAMQIQVAQINARNWAMEQNAQQASQNYALAKEKADNENNYRMGVLNQRQQNQQGVNERFYTGLDSRENIADNRLAETERHHGVQEETSGRRTDIMEETEGRRGEKDQYAKDRDAQKLQEKYDAQDYQQNKLDYNTLMRQQDNLTKAREQAKRDVLRANLTPDQKHSISVRAQQINQQLEDLMPQVKAAGNAVFRKRTPSSGGTQQLPDSPPPTSAGIDNDELYDAAPEDADQSGLDIDIPGVGKVRRR